MIERGQEEGAGLGRKSLVCGADVTPVRGTFLGAEVTRP